MQINPETGYIQEGLRWRIADKIHEKFDGTKWIRVWWWMGYNLGLYSIDWWLQGYPKDSVSSRFQTRFVYFVLDHWRTVATVLLAFVISLIISAHN